MLDRFLVHREISRDVLSTVDYHPEMAVTDRILLNSAGRNLCVLFPPWHGGGRLYNRLAWRLARGGAAVLKYVFHGEILKPDSQQVLASFRQMQARIAEDIDELAKNKRQVHAVALSLGNPVLSLVTEKFEQFDSVTMATPATSLAACMWEGIRTQPIKDDLEKQGLTLPLLEVAWNELAMVNHIPALEGKEVNVVVSKTDEIIPAAYQQEYVEALQSSGIRPNIQATQLGHYATTVNFCLRGSVK